MFWLLFGAPTPAAAQTISQLNTQYSSTTAELIVQAYAVHEGIPWKSLYDTLNCESGMNASAIGDHGTSFGVAQIHLPAHPDITKKETLDPYFAIGWAAHQFKLGHATMWTCYRELRGSDSS